MNLFKLDNVISMMAAPIIWTVHFVLCYSIVSLACGFGWTDVRLFGMNPADIGVAVFTVAALALLAYTGVQNFEKYRMASTGAAEDGDMSAFFALNSLLLCALSTVALVWVAFPTLMLPTCAI